MELNSLSLIVLAGLIIMPVIILAILRKWKVIQDMKAGKTPKDG